MTRSTKIMKQFTYIYNHNFIYIKYFLYDTFYNIF